MVAGRVRGCWIAIQVARRWRGSTCQSRRGGCDGWRVEALDFRLGLRCVDELRPVAATEQFVRRDFRSRRAGGTNAGPAPIFRTVHQTRAVGCARRNGPR